ncbi:conserved domain protein [Ehrlichia chaffeensis str. Arkansas]|uniref:Conserved domain protein n=1 Tax=Ehrlichia chaffeensis (strain ATCC CRL-10679 / Arkansas) TaxID=205920 RepID=Q2GG06_EHRCR|nr:conserved domain protein [Ehrlichia chaffeensis str. Arkansas]AHX07624.1 hypothetical protein ECHOSC_0746 [Ehrlichia chaffeensis str. Osceola]
MPIAFEYSFQIYVANNNQCYHITVLELLYKIVHTKIYTTIYHNNSNTTLITISPI